MFVQLTDGSARGESTRGTSDRDVGELVWERSGEEKAGVGDRGLEIGETVDARGERGGGVWHDGDR